MKKYGPFEVQLLAIQSFEANHRLAEQSPDSYPHVTGYYSEITNTYPSGAVEVTIQYTVDNGQSSEKRGSIYLFGPSCPKCNGTKIVKGRFVTHKGYVEDQNGNETFGCPACGGWGVDHGFRYDSYNNHLSFEEQAELYSTDPTKKLSKVWVPDDFPNATFFKDRYFVIAEISEIPHENLGLPELASFSGMAKVFEFRGIKYVVGNYENLGFEWWRLP